MPLQKQSSYLDYKMLVKVDCALITMSSRGLFKSLLLKCYSNKNLPTLTNTSGLLFSIDKTFFGDLFRLRNSSESKCFKRIKEIYNLKCVSATKQCTRCV